MNSAAQAPGFNCPVCHGRLRERDTGAYRRNARNSQLNGAMPRKRDKQPQSVGMPHLLESDLLGLFRLFCPVGEQPLDGFHQPFHPEGFVEIAVDA